MSEGARKLFAALAALDWPRVAHMGGALARELRGDAAAIDVDASRARTAGAKAIHVFEQIGRAAVGCIAPEPCTCPACRLGSKP